MDIGWLIQLIFLLVAFTSLFLSLYFTYYYAQRGLVGKVFPKRLARGIYTMIGKILGNFPYFAVGVILVSTICLIVVIGLTLWIWLDEPYGLPAMLGWYGFCGLVVLTFFLMILHYGKEEKKEPQKEEEQEGETSQSTKG